MIDGGIMSTSASADVLFEKVLEAISDQETDVKKKDNNQTICLHYFGYIKITKELFNFRGLSPLLKNCRMYCPCMKNNIIISFFFIFTLLSLLAYMSFHR